jgi:opacity protein-like surface antigen
MKRLAKAWTAVGVLFGVLAGLTSPVAAQTAPAAEDEDGASEDVEPVPPPPAPEPRAVPPPPPPPPAPEQAPPAPPIIRPYAVLKPVLVFSGRPVESFSQPNASAVTAAGNPVLAALPHEAGYTLQVAQSRLGFWFAEGQPVRGQFELDFVDFGKSSPTVQAVPRLRIAKVEWALSDSTLLSVGQDWDLWGSVNPHTIDLVASSFQAGNTGFMRQQIKLIWQNESLEVSGALGLPVVNAASKALIPEHNGLPSLAARAALIFGPVGRIGVNGWATSLRFAPNTPAEAKSFAGAFGIYGDVTPVERLNLKFEGYWGQNFANTGALALGTGRATVNATTGEAEVIDLTEVGGFLSAKYGFDATHSIYGSFGIAHILNPEDVIPSYNYGSATPDPSLPASAAVLAGTGPGMKQNLTVKLGYEYRYSKAIAFLVEGFLFKSQHVLNADADADIDGDRTAVGGEAGLLFTL